MVTEKANTQPFKFIHSTQVIIMTVKEYGKIETALIATNNFLKDLQLINTYRADGCPWQLLDDHKYIVEYHNQAVSLIYQAVEKLETKVAWLNEILRDNKLEDCSDYVEPDFIVEIKEPFKNK